MQLDNFDTYNERSNRIAELVNNQTAHFPRLNISQIILKSGLQS